MKVIFFGTPQFAVPTLEKLIQNPSIEVIAAVTQPDKPRGRGKQLIPSAVKKIALKNNLPVWQPKRIKKHTETLNLLTEANADVFVVVAYGQILSKQILDMPKLGCINVHGSILPQYRGAAPIQWSIHNGETETGITTMLMDEGLDTGDMLLKYFTPIGLLDNAHQIAEILAEKGGDLLIETIFKLEKQEINSISQDNELANYAPLIQKSDFAIDWNHSAWEIHNKVRGFYPNCVASFRDKSIKIMATTPLGEKYWSQLPPEYQIIQNQWENLSSLTGNPGEIVSNLKKFGPILQTGEGLLLLREVQLAGKRPQAGWDFVNGMRLSVGEIFTKN